MRRQDRERQKKHNRTEEQAEHGLVALFAYIPIALKARIAEHAKANGQELQFVVTRALEREFPEPQPQPQEPA